MRIAVPREQGKGEKRVALTPEGVKTLTQKGWEVAVERGAGQNAHFADDLYEASGAKLGSRAETFQGADIVATVLGGTDEETEAVIRETPEGAMLIGFLNPWSNRKALQAMLERKLTSLSMELVPRISRAQSMDALSTMSSIAGYRAALMAAELLPKFFPMLMTAAGTIPPARVFVIGAGVAGLQAIAFSRRLGAMVEAFDVRPVVKEQVESLGAKFVNLQLTAEEAEDSGGYAKEVSTDTHLRELELIASRLPKIDAVITTAMIPGKRAPILVTREMLKQLRPGSVIIDLAAVTGGNCEATVPGETVVVDGVTICAPVGLPSTLAVHASAMLSKNITELLGLVQKDGALNLEDEIIKSSMLSHQGAVVHAIIKALLETDRN